MSVSLSKNHKQTGVALITVMLIVALCAVIASQMTARLQMQMQRSANISFNQQAYWYAMGAEAFTKRVLIVNCTPLGTYPDVNKCPKLPFELINKENIFFDLVYNPSETLFMKKGKEIGCKTLNGYEMLRLQAEMSWKIWTD